MSALVTGCSIAASAGTGKTYRLTSRYLALLTLGAPISSLVALTFTRKAAGEFRRRIFQALAEGAEDKREGGRNVLTARIWATWADEEAPLYPEAIPHVLRAEKENCFPEDLPDLPEILRLNQEKYRNLLRELVTAGSRLHLSTFDSFFNTLLRTQALSLGVAGMTTISNEDLKQAQEKALLATISRLSSETVVKFLRNFRCKGKDILQTLDDWVNQYGEKLRDLSVDSSIYAGKLGLDDLTEEEELNLLELTREVGSLRSESEGRDDFLADKRSNISTALKKLEARDFSSLAGNDKKWASTEEAKKFRNKLTVLTEKVRKEILRAVQVKTRDFIIFLHLYLENYRKIISESGQFSFADITNLAMQILGDERAPGRLAYLLDGRIDHWLLDEFQDTSPIQWKTLLPLLNEIAQCDHKEFEDTRPDTPRMLPIAERSLFVVGDEKQSIYGFRGTTPEFFREIRNETPWKESMLPRRLTQSRRSAPCIMDFVNELFAAIPPLSEGEKEQYGGHSSAPNLREKKGYVKISHFSEGVNAMVHEHIVPILNKLTVNGAPLPGRSIAIITRDNKSCVQIATVLEELHFRLQVMSDTSLAVASTFGQLLLAFFRWMLHPGSEHEKSMLKVSPLHMLLEESPFPDSAPSTEGTFLAWRRLIDEEGYAAAIRAILRLVGTIAEMEEMQDSQIIREWETLALEFDKRGGSLKDWISFVSNFKPSSSDVPSYIQLLTIHKSKGMEFDAVILPFAGSKGVDDTGKMDHFVTEDSKGFLFSVSNEKKRKAWPAIERLTEDWQHKQISESMRLLYVAITRARFAVYLLLNENANNNSFSKIIDEAKPYDEIGDPEWYLQPIKDGSGADDDKETQKADDESPKPLERPTARRRVIRPSQLEPQGQVAADARATADDASSTVRLTQSGREATAYGTAVHALWEQIGWTSSPQDFPAWIHSPQGEEQQVVARALQRDDIRAILSCPDGEHWQLYREQPFVFAVQGKAELVSGTFDRVQVRTDDAGKPQEAIIIDYKTDRVTAGDDAEYTALRARHAPQMRAYRRYLAESLHLDEAAVRVALVSVPRGGGEASVQLYSATELE